MVQQASAEKHISHALSCFMKDINTV